MEIEVVPDGCAVCVLEESGVFVVVVQVVVIMLLVVWYVREGPMGDDESVGAVGSVDEGGAYVIVRTAPAAAVPEVWRCGGWC